MESHVEVTTLPGVILSSRDCDQEENAEAQGLTDGAPSRAKHTFRTALPQVLAATAPSMLIFSYGMTLGFPTIVIPALLTAGSDTLTLTMDQISWFSSIYLIIVPVGCMMSGTLAASVGRKPIMMLVNIPILVAWIMFHYADSVAILYVSLLLTGLAGGLLGAPTLTYVAEITQPHLRGMLSASMTMSVPLGILVELLLGMALEWRTVAAVNTCFPVAAFIALCFIPESPYWLVGKGRLVDAERSLCWLRGWRQHSEVHVEFTALVSSLTAVSNNTTTRPTTTWRNYTHQSFLKPFLLVTLTYFCSTFMGVLTLQTYAVPIFDAVRSPIDKYNAASYLGFLQLAGSLFCIILVRWTGKRILALVSTIGNGICFIIIGAFTYMQSGTPSNSIESYLWVPTTFLLLAPFISHVCIRLLPYILIGEVFPHRVRNLAAGASTSIGYIFSFLVNKVFLYMVDGMTLAGTFWFYSAISLLGALFFYFYLPETEGRTLMEIEEHFEGKINLTRCATYKRKVERREFKKEINTLELLESQK